MKYRVAVASSDGIVVNQHFGRADGFRILSVEKGEEGFVITQEGAREVTVLCDRGNHEEAALAETVDTLRDCQYILVSRVGERVQSTLEQNGIAVFELPGMIEESVQKMLNYIEIQALLG